MKSKTLLYGVGVILAIALWAAFRPERLFVDAKVNDAMPADLANVPETVLGSGSFHSVAHDTKGTASVYQLADGKRILRFTGFETSNGPDVHVYLVAANDASDSEAVKKAGFLELGSLKGNIGDQNYLDVNCKAHDLDNLYVVDGSFFPSSGAVNPALTIMANALRVGDHLLRRLRVPIVEYAAHGSQSSVAQPVVG